MIKEAINRILELAPTEIIEVGGQEYSTKQLYHVKEPTPSPIVISTLTGLVDYIKKDVDNHGDLLIIQVVSPTKVVILSGIKPDMQRDCYVECKAWTPDITFERFMDVENFNIMLQSCFGESDDRSKILKVIGNIVEEDVRTTGDDGVSQVVTAKTGITKREEVIVPNPVVLYPFRTFVEIDQPKSEFVFRMRAGGPSAALFEADGGIWRIFAMDLIKEYLEDNLKGISNVQIIS